MGDNRAPGRYNLHRLGWTAFEDLCMQIMRVVLGETCTRFRWGADEGRDGWFEGQAAGLLDEHNHLVGTFVIQCKHTSQQKDALNLADLKSEFAKVAEISAKYPLNYILMTNRQISAPAEAAIREKFETISGVKSCMILSETWIEDTVDAHPRLLRLVPRLYGIGDLSQIVSATIEKQTAAVLEDLAVSLRTFVPTESYRTAEEALETYGFVVLVGPAASGKSAIAANLCMVSIAQNTNVRVLRIEHADQFKATWSPADAHTIYWVDDVFGETTLDDNLVKEWSAAFQKVESARRRGSRVIFCTRDYILTAAEKHLKKNKVEFINDARVRVDVTALSDAECDGILYNHVKDGDITQKQKLNLKIYLSYLARLDSFSPELARRLGSEKFNKMRTPSQQELARFFNQPVEHLREIIHGLSAGETAALAVCLLSSNSVTDPIPDDALAEAVLKTYGVSMQQVRVAFEMLEGSLVKRVRNDTRQIWQLHHPSMIEALQEELSNKSSQIVLYLQSARISAVLRDTTTLAAEADSRLVFLPESVYIHLINRFRIECTYEQHAIAQYLVKRASDRFIIDLDSHAPAVIDGSLALSCDPYDDPVPAQLAVRLSHVTGALLLSDTRKELLVETLADSLAENGSAGFLRVKGFELAIPGVISEFLDAQIENDFSSIDTLYEWATNDLSSMDHVNSAREALSDHLSSLRNGLSAAKKSSENSSKFLAAVERRYEERLQEREIELQEREDERAESRQEEWSLQRYEERMEMENGRFSDVDE